MPRKRKAGTLFIGPDPHMATCERCGGTVPKPPFPISIPAFVKYTAYAEELHRDCKPKGDAND